MIKDTKISEIFQIPSRMLQRWKNSNDYRFLIYTYLHNSDAAEVEAFFKYLASKKVSSSNNVDKEKPALKFLYKKDFISLLREHIKEYLAIDNLKVYIKKEYASILIQNDSLEIGIFTACKNSQAIRNLCRVGKQSFRAQTSAFENCQYQKSSQGQSDFEKNNFYHQ